MDASPFALFEIDALACKIALSPTTSAEMQPLAELAPVVVLDAQGEWQLGREALRLRMERPQACVLDLLRDPELDPPAEQKAGWPFAQCLVREDGSVAWRIDNRVYPRAWLLSRLLLHAREKVEVQTQSEVRAMAIIGGRAISPSLRQDFETAARLVRLQPLWWIDRSHALAYGLRASQARAQKAKEAEAQPQPSEPVSNKGEEDPSDPLSRIDEVLGMAPSGAQLSQVEFGEMPTSDAQQGVDTRPGEDQGAPDAPVAEDSDHDAASAPADEDQGLAQDEPAKDPDVPCMRGHWLWVADGHSLELTQVQLEPEMKVLGRRIFPEFSRLLWLDKLVTALDADLSQQGLPELGEQSLARMRVWDGCAKLMDKLRSEAQVEMHLPHLCVHRDQSFHYQASWARRRMDALVAEPVAELRGYCEAQGEPWQWGRYGSQSEMPAWTRVAAQCEHLHRSKARLEETLALEGASAWIRERQGEGARTLVSDLVVGDLMLEHPSGAKLEVAADHASLPFQQDLDLGTDSVPKDDTRPWTLRWRVGEHRYWVAAIRIPELQKDARVRIEVTRQGRVLASRTPAAKNAGALELEVLPCGLDSAQIEHCARRQAQCDYDRFVQMRCEAMRKALAQHCSHLSNLLSERGEKMDDLLRARLSEWIGQTQAALHPDRVDAPDKVQLQALEPVQEQLANLLDSLTAPQRKALGVTLGALPALVDAPDASETVVVAHPWWVETATPPNATASSAPAQALQSI